jgi:5-methylcytosine-specific restriction endonuclease McrA
MNTLAVWIVYMLFFRGNPKARKCWYRHLYLESNHWKRKARRIRRLAGYKCQKCGKARPLDVHHKTYKRLFWEWDRDLEALCRTCHRKEHNGRK